MKNFNYLEFDSPDEPGSGRKMNQSFLESLDFARSIAGVPFKINSGYRTEEHNKKVGGSPTSSHMIGRAADIHCTDSHDRYRILKGLHLAGFSRVGIAKTFIHVDNDPDKSSAVWVY